MAAADIDVLEFGLKVGGTGTDETEVFADKRYIKMLCFSGNADNATCELATKDPSGAYVDVHALKSSDTNELNAASGNYIWFGERGSPFVGLKVTLSHANDRLYIHFA